MVDVGHGGGVNQSTASGSSKRPADAVLDVLQAVVALGEHGERSERDLLSRSLALLEGPEREAIALRFGADLSVAEIAKLTGERAATVEARVYRALRKLRDALA